MRNLFVVNGGMVPVSTEARSIPADPSVLYSGIGMSGSFWIFNLRELILLTSFDVSVFALGLVNLKGGFFSERSFLQSLR